MKSAAPAIDRQILDAAPAGGIRAGLRLSP
jgi:hypothetical protein